MILGCLKTVDFKSSLTFDICIDIQVCGSMVLVVLKVTVEYIERIGKSMKKVCYLTRHSSLVVGSSILEFLPELL